MLIACVRNEVPDVFAELLDIPLNISLDAVRVTSDTLYTIVTYTFHNLYVVDMEFHCNGHYALMMRGPSFSIHCAYMHDVSVVYSLPMVGAFSTWL